MSKTEIANNLSAFPTQQQASHQIQTISELQSMLATISGQLSQFQSLTDSQLMKSLSRLTDQTQSRLDQLQGITEKQLSETLEVVATDTRSQVFQAMQRVNQAAEKTLSEIQSEASKAYDEPLGELLEQVRKVSEAMAKLSDEAWRALVSEVKGLRVQNKRLNELMLHFGQLSEQLETSVQAAKKENQKAKTQNDQVGRQWWQVAIMAAVLSTCVSTLITSGLWLIATR
jgi:hypothetical protein